MLLLHQAGGLKIGEVVRYTVTYTPAHDRILPPPSQLHLKIKNTSAIALRAAFVHGPYTLYVAAYPSNFHPDEKFETPRRDGVPEFEPQLKAGGSFSTQLLIPEEVRRAAGSANRQGRSANGDDGGMTSVTWIIEVSSQVIFSNSAVVHYEILLGRDEKSLSFAFGKSITGGPTPVPGQVSDHQQSQGANDGLYKVQPKGIYSSAIKLRVDDTASLWNTPKMPESDGQEKERAMASNKDAPVESAIEGRGDAPQEQEGNRIKKQKKVHLVVLTHGLHSNLGADMLYLKESIDATAKQAKIDARARREKKRREQQLEENLEEDDEDDEEEVIVRGFSGNAVRTERGIKYLGKRLAKYVLVMTYPDQPYRPVTKKMAADALSHAVRPDHLKVEDPGVPIHHHSTILKEPYHDRKSAYKISSISFIAHSLGGLIQTYAVAYIQKHSPEFFDNIRPVNFIALATPFLGLSNENPLYVKFALDFGLVGRTGKDLGLTWRAPTLARSGWGAIVSGISESAHKKIDGEIPPESKPLLRILPTGPAHTALKKFRNRTVYSNVVNDGIVPLRTSCLLFLDWQGLGRVEKARRENGLVGTVAEWGWAEITGANSSSSTRCLDLETGEVKSRGDNTPTMEGHGGDVPQPSPTAAKDDSPSMKSPSLERRLSALSIDVANDLSIPTTPPISPNLSSPMATFFDLFRPNPVSQKNPSHPPKYSKIYTRSQTIKVGSESSIPTLSTTDSSSKDGLTVTTGDSELEHSSHLSAPPKTTFFESAGDVLKPPLPTVKFLIDPASRPVSIFHDRLYRPEDIPAPPLKKRRSSPIISRRASSGMSKSDFVPPQKISQADSTLSSRDYDDTKNTNPGKDPREVVDGSSMKVEEKIARAYHRDMSWRKVLVRLEPDAHNNMIVRRMFANAYGWPVVKHLCDAHFSDAAAVEMGDEVEDGNVGLRGSPLFHEEGSKVTEADGSPEYTPDASLSMSASGAAEVSEATDEVPALHPSPTPSNLSKALAARRPAHERMESANWSDRDWADSGDESEEEGEVYTKPSDTGSGPSKKPAWNWTEVIAGKGASSSKNIPKPDGGRRKIDEVGFGFHGIGDFGLDTKTVVVPADSEEVAEALDVANGDHGPPENEGEGSDLPSGLIDDTKKS